SWGRGSTALGYSLSWLCFVVFAPVAGWLHDRWGARAIVAMGGLGLGVALALTGQVTSLTEYYLYFGVLGAAGTACILIPSTTIVSRWFVRSRGTAMGVLSAATPGGAVVFYPVNAWLIATLGWRGALVCFACIVAVATVSLALLYRNLPADKGHSARGAAAMLTGGAGRIGGVWTIRRALRSIRLWAAFASRSSRRFRPIPSRGHIWARSSEWSRLAAALAARSAPFSAGGSSTSQETTDSHSPPPPSP